MKKYLKFILGLSLFFALTGCGTSVSELESQVMDLFNEKAAEEDLELYATDVTLVHVKDNQYEGIITISDGEETVGLDISVLFDGESFMYEIPELL